MNPVSTGDITPKKLISKGAQKVMLTAADEIYRALLKGESNKQLNIAALFLSPMVCLPLWLSQKVSSPGTRDAWRFV